MNCQIVWFVNKCVNCVCAFCCRTLFILAGMHRSTSDLSSSSADHLRPPWSDDVKFGVRSHASAISSNKSPVKFQIQSKHRPIVQYKSNKTEGSTQRGTTDTSKPVTSKSVSDLAANYKLATRTEALKNLSLYASDSDSDQVNELVAQGKPHDGSKSSSGTVSVDVNVPSAKKVNNDENQKVSLKPKSEDSTPSSHRLHKKEHSADKKERSSDVRDKEQRSGHRDRDDSERRRSSQPKERCSSKDRETVRRKDVLDAKKTEEHAKPGNEHRSEKKSREDEKADDDRSRRHSDHDLKKSREHSSHSVTKEKQTQRDTSTSQQSSSDRRRESSRSSKDAKKSECDRSPVESKHKTLSSKIKSPSRADSSNTSRRKSSDSTSRSSNKTVVEKDSSVKPKPKETESHKKAEVDVKPVKKDKLQRADDKKPDAAKTVEKPESVSQRKHTSREEKTTKVKDNVTIDDKRHTVADDGNVDDKRHKVASSPNRTKSSSLSALPSDKKSSASRKRLSPSTSSSSSSSSSGSDSSSSDSDSSSSSSSSSSDNSDEEDIAATAEKSRHHKTSQQKGKRSHLQSRKPSVSEDKSKLDCDKKADGILTGNVPVVESVLRKEAGAILDTSTNKEGSTDHKHELVAIQSGVSDHPDVKVPVSEAPARKRSTELYSPSFPTDLDGGWEDEVCADAARWSSSESDIDDVPPPPPPPPPCTSSNTPQPSSTAVISVGHDRSQQSSLVLEPATADSKQDVIASGSGDTSAARSVVDAGERADRAYIKKDAPERALPKVGTDASVNDDGKSQDSRLKEQSASGKKSNMESDSKKQDRPRSSRANSRSCRSRSRSRSRERRQRTTKDAGHATKDVGRSKDSADRQHSTELDKNASRRRGCRRSPSPSVVYHVDKSNTCPVRSLLAPYDSSRRPVQNSDVRQKSSSYSSHRTAATRQPPSRNSLKSDDPVVVIDTDDEDVENLESIPLPVAVPNVELDDIPLPVPVSESVSTTDQSTSLVHSTEKKLDSVPQSVPEKQKSSEEEVGGDEADYVDMDLDDDDHDDDSCQNEKNVATATVSAGSQKAPVFPLKKIVLSIGGRSQTSCEQNVPDTTSETSNTVAWKRKLAAGLLKAPTLMAFKSETVTVESPTEKSDDSEAPVSSAALEVGKNSDPVTEVKREVLSEKPSSQIEEVTKLDATSSADAPVAEKLHSVSSNSSTTAVVRPKSRRRFSDTPREKSDTSSGDKHSKSSLCPHHSVTVVRAYCVLSGDKSKQQCEKDTDSVGSGENKKAHSPVLREKYKNSVDVKSGELTNPAKTKNSVREKPNSLCGTVRTEHGSECHESKNSNSSATTKEQVESEHKISRSSASVNKNTEQHSSGKEENSPRNSKDKLDNNDSSKARDRTNSDDDRKRHSSSRRHRSRRSSSNTGLEQDRNRDISGSLCLQKRTSDEKPRHEQDDRSSHSGLRTESSRHSKTDGSSWCDDTAVKQSNPRHDNPSHSDKDASNRNNGRRSRRSLSRDRVSNPHADDLSLIHI